MTTARWLLLLSLGLASAGCGLLDGDDEKSDLENPAAVRTCRQIIEAFADQLIQICDEISASDRTELIQTTESGLPAGTCNGADAVRDADQVEIEGLPGIRAKTDCPTTSAEMSGFLPGSCGGQILFEGY